MNAESFVASMFHDAFAFVLCRVESFLVAVAADSHESKHQRDRKPAMMPFCTCRDLQHFANGFDGLQMNLRFPSSRKRLRRVLLRKALSSKTVIKDC